ncbi:sulfotransferase family 2 domain-containing protein [Roseovarius aestuariivivens]|uniref:sulfotransferase family 2 domain-containing protein n=1 Tax=Roseovarius aestuariivivens TaxID=1888910 RepID=UPI001080AF5F|nr:sulfotransferase family 2 domain-containing protein [Roseovarius aestuariivivens]
MPILRAHNRLIYFIHVPKCAGSAVETYLQSRFGRLAFLDNKFYSVPARQRWSKSSPQHIPLEQLKRIFPLHLFDAIFGITRHPVDRLASVYLFKLEVEREIDPGTSFSEWLDRVETLRARSPFAYDNHVRPISDFIPQKAGLAKVFRLEDGLETLVPWLDAQLGQSDGPRQIPLKQARSLRFAAKEMPEAAFRVGEADRARIYDMYKKDYERFGYDRDAPTRY